MCLDTAFNYNTEESIGKVLKEWIDSGKVKRQDLFITTKVSTVCIMHGHSYGY